MSLLKSKLRLITRDTRGVSVMVATSLMLIMLLLGAAALKLVLSFTHSASRAQQANAAFFAAEGGVEQALYEISLRQDGYEFNSEDACDATVNLNQTAPFSKTCNTGNRYRFLGFTSPGLSHARAFWRLFARTQPSLQGGTTATHIIPNPYFVGNKDGKLDIANSNGTNEWGVLSKNRPLALALQRDDGNGLTKIGNVQGNVIFMLDPKEKINWSPANNGGEQPLLTWILSAVDENNVEYTLQGVIREDDFDSCDDYGWSSDVSSDEKNQVCFQLPLANDAGNPNSELGSPLTGQDINGNIPPDNTTDGFNRVAGVKENYKWNSIQDFMSEFNSEAGWHNGRLSISLVGTLAETSGISSNTLRYKVVASKVNDGPITVGLPDEYTYIVSEGFAGPVKQTIETRFRRQTTLPIFSYVIFQ